MSLGLPDADTPGVPNPDDFRSMHHHHNLHPHHYYFLHAADSKPAFPSSNTTPYDAAPQEQRMLEYTRSLSQGTARRLVPAATYLAVLVCLAASLLILPLILPPLPPPPLMLLLLLPIGIMGMLMVLAFMPSNHAKDITSSHTTYM
ncbi:ARGOS-like protein [Cucurbita maxima]|uniref:ARGOS-like protein n=1 Tax=Cucurbita maxima TaxID=3661 RepID=A0A6J1ICV1_CUCMA|nr:ARGOS-like protein [Cucurbita maxima]XP_022974016.1 ARGOS-like protein [Cucurbita maxima]